MNTKIITLAGTIILTACLSTSAHANIVGGSFETGDLSGWTASSNTSVVSSNSGYNPTDGNYFALLTTGLGQDVYSTISQSFSAMAGSVLSFDAFFKTTDYLPYDDNGYVRLLDVNNTPLVTLFSSSVGAVGDGGGSPWASVSYTFLTGGNFTLQAGVANIGDNGFESILGIDRVSVSTVPAPPALLLFGSGLLGFLGMRKKLVISV